MINVDFAIQLALNAHTGQLDKAGQPYILHPLRLMMKFDDPDKRIVEVLHDVVEDSDITFEDLKNYGLSEQIISALKSLTRNEDESYEEFIHRVSLNDIAKAVKIEDLKDNMNLLRLSSINEHDLMRVKKYHKALMYLMNGVLYK